VVRINLNRRAILFSVSIVAVLFLALYNTCMLSAESKEDEITVTISIMGDKEIKKFGRKVFVTGIWNWINISFDKEVSEVNLSLYKGDTPPLTRDKKSFYAWRYSNGWEAVTVYDGNEYIDKDNCKKIGSKFCFRVTTEDFLENSSENWTLKVKYDNEEKNISILMEKPMGGLAVTGGITVRVEPFQIVTAYGEHYFTTINSGNVPMSIDVSYDAPNDSITTSNTNVILLPGEELHHSVEIKTQAWKPGIIKIGGVITGVIPDDIIPIFNVSQATVRLDTAFSFPWDDLITIIVGHSDYELHEIEKEGKLTFQCKKEVEIYSDEEKNITSYLCGEGNVSLSIQSENLSILGLWLDGNKMNKYSNITIQLDPSKESKVDIEVKVSEGAKNAKLIYILERGEEVYTYHTNFIVKEKPKETKPVEKENILPKILIGMGIIISLTYIIVTYLRGRKR